MTHLDNHNADVGDRNEQAPTASIAGPGELITAVPHLLGFHPEHSLVLLGLHGQRLVVTARLDLPDHETDDPADDEWIASLRHTVATMRRSGVDRIVTITYPSELSLADANREGDPAAATSLLPFTRLHEQANSAITQAGVVALDAMLVANDRWQSYACGTAGCCPPDGHPLPTGISAFQAASVVAGANVAPNREALAERLAPSLDRDRLSEVIIVHEQADSAAVREGRQDAPRRAATRALFAAARASSHPGWTPPSDETAARFGVALSSITVRDAVWLAVDSGRLDGQPLWLDLTRRLPDPHRAGPAFLAGWQAWRSGDGATARIAADHALTVDPGYSAARLLLVALDRGINPATVARLARERGARLTT